MIGKAKEQKKKENKATNAVNGNVLLEIERG